MQPDHTVFMDRAIALVREAIEAGDGPAGSVIVAQGDDYGLCGHQYRPDAPSLHRQAGGSTGLSWIFRSPWVVVGRVGLWSNYGV